MSAAATMPARPPRQCRYCGSTFTPRRDDQRFCSATCNRAQRKVDQQRAKQQRPQPGGVCQWCEEPFKGKGQYCCTKCQQAWNNFWKSAGPAIAKGLTDWRVKKIKGALTELCRTFGDKRKQQRVKGRETKDKRKGAP